MDWSIILDSLRPLGQGLIITIILTVSSIALSTLLGLVVGTLRTLRIKPLTFGLRIYLELFRGTPLLIQLLFIYYGAFYLGFGNIPALVAAIIVLTLFEGAFISEIIRAGLESVPGTQREAGQVLGLTRFQTWFRVILPQARTVSVPPLIGQYIALVKDTSLASIIGLSELMLAGQLVVSRTSQPAEVYFTIAVIYFIICFPLSITASRLERAGGGNLS